MNSDIPVTNWGPVRANHARNLNEQIESHINYI